MNKSKIFLQVYFPELKSIFIRLSIMIMDLFELIDSSLTIHANPIFWLKNHIHNVIDKRLTQEPNHREVKDYLQILVDSIAERVDDEECDMSKKLDEKKYEKKMTMVTHFIQHFFLNVLK